MYSMELIGAHVVNEEGVFIGVIDSIAENAHGVVITVEEMDEADVPKTEPATVHVLQGGKADDPEGEK